MVDPDGHTWVHRYDATGDTVATVDPFGATTTTCYDAVGRTTAVVSPTGNVGGADPTTFTTRVTNNARGQAAAIGRPAGAHHRRCLRHRWQPALRHRPVGHATTLDVHRR